MARRLGSNKWLGIVLLLAIATLLLAGCLVKPGKQPSQLTYSFPTKLTIKAGNVLPGTDMRYDRMSEQGAYVTIKGQQALKRQGDSLDWSGSLGAGVQAELKLRVVLYTESELHLVGTAKIVIENTAPKRGAIATSSVIEFSGPVAYGMAKGAFIPGSTLTYEGPAEDGAKLGGVEGYPYRKVGDSIFWEGVLRDGIYLRLDVRVVQFDDEGLRVTGLATIWIGS